MRTVHKKQFYGVFSQKCGLREGTCRCTVHSWSNTSDLMALIPAFLVSVMSASRSRSLQSDITVSTTNGWRYYRMGTGRRFGMWSRRTHERNSNRAVIRSHKENPATRDGDFRVPSFSRKPRDRDPVNTSHAVVPRQCDISIQLALCSIPP